MDWLTDPTVISVVGTLLLFAQPPQKWMEIAKPLLIKVLGAEGAIAYMKYKKREEVLDAFDTLDTFASEQESPEFKAALDIVWDEMRFAEKKILVSGGSK